MISLPRLGRITQGTVFCGAFAEDYETVPVWGVIITARCDTAHEKTPVINYLPVVRVEDWLIKHGGFVIIDRAVKDLINRFKNMIKQRGLSDSLLDVYNPTYIVETNFGTTAGNSASRRIEKDAHQAKELATQIEQLNQYLSTGNTDSLGVRKALSTCQKHVEAVLRELCSHQLSGYYFIQDIGKLTECSSELGYVVLLREIHHLPRHTANVLSEGIEEQYASTHLSLSFSCFDFVCPVAEIQSPWIEHLMQSFCNLFGRIGIVDVKRSIVGSIIEKVTATQEFEK